MVIVKYIFIQPVYVMIPLLFLSIIDKKEQRLLICFYFFKFKSFSTQPSHARNA